MADSTVVDFSKMKVTELRKELKARGFSSAGDKSELVARLQAAEAPSHEDAEYALDSDEIDSDSVLDDTHLTDDLPDLEPIDKSKEPESKPKTLKRKLVIPPAAEKNGTKLENDEGKETTAKKIVLHRPASVPTVEPKVDKAAVPVALEPIPKQTSEVIKASTAPVDSKAKLELRAKRFGLPMTDSARKEARKIRFGQTAITGTTIAATESPGSKVTPLDSNVEKLKKRAERFGQSVSKAMTDIETQERLEKRRSKFGLVK